MTQPNRLPANAAHGFGGGALDRGKSLRFRLNGRLLEGYQGDTVLSAALAAGLFISGRHGDEPIALDEDFAPPVVPLHGKSALPMDRTPAQDGVDYQTLGLRRDPIASRGMLGHLRHLLLGPARTLNLRFDDAAGILAPWLDADPDTELSADLVVIGAGVAGLAAAVAAAEAGRSVIVVERTPDVGGMAVYFGATDDEERPRARIQRLHEAARAAGVQFLLGTDALRLIGSTVIAHQVRIDGPVPTGAVLSITGKRIVIATGARERLPLFPGNRTPGVVGAHAAWRRAERYGIWAGRRAVIATPYSVAYRLALRAADAGVEVQRIVDSRIHPHSRYVDFCKATGITLASGLVPSGARPLARNKPGLSVSFAVAIAEIEQDSAAIETDQLIAAGSWQPDLSLWLAAGGSAHWDAKMNWVAADGTLEHVTLAGSAAGWLSTHAVEASGRVASGVARGKAAKIEEKLISELYETPDAPTSVAPYRADVRGATYLDHGRTLATRRDTASERNGAQTLSIHARPLSLGDVAAAVSLGLIAADSAGAVAEERCMTGIEITNTGWTVPTGPTAPETDPPPFPVWLTGRFGDKPNVAVLKAGDARAFGIGCLVYQTSDAGDPAAAIGVIYAARPGGGGIAVTSHLPEGADMPLFVRDAGGMIRASVAERLKAPKR
ncbi:FAD-dependent oxidoreductase [Devosia sp.]|uniref:FAD-dependent oxidoreductase n=1 Tax=Devosia sp. TaxID=1871048 RepID=UPI003A948F21